MKYILKRVEITKIKQYLSGDLEWRTSLNRGQRNTLTRKAVNFRLQNDKLFLLEGDLRREVIADDDADELHRLLTCLHLPDHKGMKVMYKNSKTMYAGFKRSHIDNFVSRCDVCRRHKPMTRVAPITPIVAEHPWQRIQIDYVDLRNFAVDNDG